MLVIIILLLLLLATFLIFCLMPEAKPKPIPAPWKPPAELTKEDSEWVWSHLDIAGVPRPKFQNLGHTKPKRAGLAAEIERADVMSSPTGYAKGSVWGYPPPGMRRPSPIQAGSKRSPEQRAAARSAGYVHRPQAEIDKCVGYLKNLEAKRPGYRVPLDPVATEIAAKRQQTPDLMDWHSKNVTYNYVNDTYRVGGREITGAVVRDIMLDGTGNFIGYLEEPTYKTVWK